MVKHPLKLRHTTAALVQSDSANGVALGRSTSLRKQPRVYRNQYAKAGLRVLPRRCLRWSRCATYAWLRSCGSQQFDLIPVSPFCCLLRFESTLPKSNHFASKRRSRSRITSLRKRRPEVELFCFELDDPEVELFRLENDGPESNYLASKTTIPKSIHFAPKTPIPKSTYFALRTTIPKSNSIASKTPIPNRFITD